MKKFGGVLILVFAIFFCSCFFTACDDTITANFKQNEISIFVGQKYDPYDYIEQEIDDSVKKKITFESANSSILYITPEQEFVAVKYGSTMLYVLYNNTPVAEVKVNVNKTPVQLETPVNLFFDEDKGALVWNYTYYEINDKVQLLQNYELEITKSGQQTQTIEITDKNYFNVDVFGTYSARVKAIAPSDAYVSSSYSAKYDFCIMSKPLDLQYNDETKILSWNTNANPLGTKYNITYTLAGQNEITVENITDSQYTIPQMVNAGTHQFCVTTVPANSTYFKGVSDTLKIEKLSTPALAFNNGVVSWTGNNKATSYTINILKFDDNLDEWKKTDISETILETGLITVSSYLPQKMCVEGGKYQVEIIANGNVANYVYNCDKAVFNFEKLALPKVKYNPMSKIFEIVNTASVNGNGVVVLTQSLTNESWGDAATKSFDKTDNKKYGISAKFTTNNPLNSIDSETTNIFFVDEDLTGLTAIQNLSNVDLRYVENSVYSYVQYTPMDSNCEYQLFVDDIESSLIAEDNKYNLGTTSNLFTDAQTQHNYRLTVTKPTQQTKTYFVDKEFEINVKQLEKPTLLAYDGNKVKVDATLTDNIVKVDYAISVDNGAFIKTQQLKSGSEWVVKAKFVANNQKFIENKIDTYYSSSANASFQIKKLQQPQQEDIFFNYLESKLIFEPVENAKEYNIYQNGELLQTITTTETVLENIVGDIEIEAVPNSWETIQSNVIGYLTSNKTTYTIYQIADISNLYLEKDENHIVTAKWTAPQETYQKNVLYAVCVKYLNPDSENNGFVTVANELLETQYSFNESAFDQEGSYEIKVTTLSPNNDFYVTDTSELVQLTRLSAPTTLSRISDNTLDVSEYDVRVMTKINVEMYIDDAEEPHAQFSQTTSSFSFSVADCQILKIKVSVDGKFNAQTKTYNLDSLYSEFYIQRLGQVQNLTFDNYADNSIFNFSWESMEKVNNAQPKYLGFEYYFENLSTLGTVISSSSISTRTSNELTIEDTSGNALKLYVKEIVTSKYAKWQSISKDATEYLPSLTYNSVLVKREDSVQNLTLTITDENVIASWTYTPQDELSNVYNPVFNFSLTKPNSTDPVKDQPKDVNGYDFNESTQKYEKIYDKSTFTEVGDYTINVWITSSKTITSQKNWVMLTKLKQVGCITINENEGVCKYIDKSNINFPHDSSLVITSEANVTIKNAATIDLSNVTNTTQETEFSIYHKASVLPVEVETGYNKYYLDSEKTIFRIIRLSNVKVTHDTVNDKLVWQDMIVDPNIMTYTISIDRQGSSSSITNNYDKNELSMSAAELTTDKVKEGTNSVKVRTIVAINDIQAYDENQHNIGYLSSQFGEACEIIKLATPKNVKLVANDTQEEVTISWDAVEGEDVTYNVYVYEQGQEKGLPIYDTQELSVKSNTWFDSGAKCVQIEAVEKGKITSSLSDVIVCVRLDSITEKSVNVEGILSWNNTNQIKQNSKIANSFQYFNIEVLNSSSQKMFEVNVGKNLSYDLLSYQGNNETFLQNLNGEKFAVKIAIIGSGQSENGIITLSSQETLGLQAEKLAKPNILIENGLVVLKDTNESVDDVVYFVTISNGNGNYYNKKYTKPISIDDQNQNFVVSAYATTSSINKLKSNSEICNISKLTAPTNLDISLVEGSDNILQNQVKITWDAVDDATNYFIFVDGTKIDETDELSYTFNDIVFAEANKYSVQVQAVVANDYLYSDLSNSISVVRLNSMQGAYIDKDAIVHFANTQQFDETYTIYTYLEGTALESSTSLPNNTLTFEDYQSYLQDKESFSGGLFTIKIQYIGSGITDENNVCTLSSVESIINGFKLYAPDIKIQPDKAIIEYDKTTTQIPSGQQIENIAQNVFSATKDDLFAKDENGNSINNVITNQFEYPNCWEAGDYVFTAQTLPKEVLNVLPSDVTIKQTTRLNAPINLAFERLAVDNDTIYFADDNTSTNKIGTVLQFSFEGVENANCYSIFNDHETYANDLKITKLQVTNNFEKFVYSGDNKITIISMASEGGSYINSQSTTINFDILDPVTKFYTNGTNVLWKINNTTSVESLTGYVIRANSVGGQTKYWQTSNPSQMQSSLTDLLFEGNVSMNIKLIGNVDENKKYESIVLDSRYITKNNEISNQEFYKIEHIASLSTNKGFFEFTIPENATLFKAYICANDEVIKSVYLEDYRTKIEWADNTKFLGYNKEIASLPATTDYTIYVVAENENMNQKTLFSDSSNQITAQVLSNKNPSALSLVKDTDNDLTKKIVNVGVDQKASGVWILENGKYVFDDNISNENYVYRPVVTTSDTLTIAFASCGSTCSADNGHYLTSLFSMDLSLIVPEKTTISVVNGQFVWTKIENISGYYVYVNDNLFNNEVYNKTTLSVNDILGGTTNNLISLKVVPVCCDDDRLWGPESNYQISALINNEQTYNKKFTTKLHKPQALNVSEGTLLWSEGVTGLNTYNNDYFVSRCAEISANPTSEKVDELCAYIENLFVSPITLYSKYSGFNDLKIDLFLTDAENKTYSLTTDAYKFLTLTQSQYENLVALKATLSTQIDLILQQLNVSSLKNPYSLTNQTFANNNEYISAILNKIKSQFASSNFDALLSCVNNKGYWPTIDMLFEEFENDQTATLAGGLYKLAIMQHGNNFDWLNSSKSDSQNIYVVEELNILDISSENNNFFIDFEKCNLNPLCLYNSLITGALGTTINYVLVGEDVNGNRSILTKTCGIDISEGVVRIDLTELIENSILTPEITKLFVYVDGSYYTTYTQAQNMAKWQVISGVKSRIVNIKVLSQLAPKFENGEIKIDENTPQFGFEIASYKGDTLFDSEVITNIYWKGESSYLLESGQVYNISLRSVGTSGQTYDNVVLSGKSFKFTATKLATPEVVVNNQGVFEWSSAYNSNSSGFILYINDDETSPIINNLPGQTTYESNILGYNNYKFRMMGTTSGVIQENASGYYINSNVHNSQDENVFGSNAVIISAIDNALVENGLLKWQSINTSQVSQNKPILSDNQKVNDYYKIIIDTNLMFDTRNIDSNIYSTDVNGLRCLDLTNQNVVAGKHTIEIQAYLMIEENNNEQISKNLHDEIEYYQLLGEKYTIQTVKSAQPTNIKIVNGEIVWTGNVGDTKYRYQIIDKDGGIISGETTTTNLWPSNIATKEKYTIRIKAYQENTLCSSYTTMANSYGEAFKFEKITFTLPDEIEYGNDSVGNYITIKISQSDYNYGLNIKYKLGDETTYNLLKCGDEDYAEIVTKSTENSEVTFKINVSKLSNGKQHVSYCLQLAYLGETSFVASNFTNELDYIMPQKLNAVYFDETTCEYYFEAEKNKIGYYIQDELLNSDLQVVATYYYQIQPQEYSEIIDQNYIKYRTLDDNSVATINFTPVVMGYSHRVSVATISMIENKNIAKMSDYTECENIYDGALFNKEQDLFAADSNLYACKTQDAVAKFLKENAYGTENNAYLIYNKNDFAKINSKLDKFDYLSQYDVLVKELSSSIGLVSITEDTDNFYFKQQNDIDVEETIIGLRNVVGIGVEYIGFSNTYDGQGFTISYTLTPTIESDKFALFRVIEDKGIVKNLKIDGTIKYQNVQQLGGLTAENNGTIENVTINNITIKNLQKDIIEIDSQNLKTCYIGVVACENKGTISNVVNNSSSVLNVSVLSKGISVYVGGLVAKNDTNAIIQKSGNKMQITVVGTQNVYVGGVVANNYGKIEQCYNFSIISATSSITQSNVYVGGVVGYNENGVINCVYAKGEIKVSVSSNGYNVFAGGIVGYTNSANIKNSYSGIATIDLVTSSSTVYCGTLIGKLDVDTRPSNNNYFANNYAIGNDLSYSSGEFAEKININAVDGMTTLKTKLNAGAGDGVFVIISGNIALWWEK